MGRTFARELAQSGHTVMIANSRGPDSLVPFAAEVGAKAVRVAEVAAECELILLAIPTKAVPVLRRNLWPSAARAPIVVDVGNYHPQLRDGRIAAIDAGMLDSQWVAQQLEHPVIKGFNTILAASLIERARPQGAPDRIALPVAGDATGDKATVLRLVDELGFDPVDAGSLDESWRQQTGAPAYCKDLPLAALRQALAAAERSRVAEYRAAREAELKGA